MRDDDGGALLRGEKLIERFLDYQFRFRVKR
jgi:hypothetical protein